MQNYVAYSAEDFILDENFQRWVKKSSAADNAFWQDWLAQHPHKRPEIEEAKSILLAIRFNETFSKEEKAHMWTHIEAVTENEPVPAGRRQGRIFPTGRMGVIRIAAVFTFLAVAFGLALFYGRDREITITTGYAGGAGTQPGVH